MSHLHEVCISLVDFILTSVNSEFTGVRVVTPLDLPRCNQIFGSSRDTQPLPVPYESSYLDCETPKQGLSTPKNKVLHCQLPSIFSWFVGTKVKVNILQIKNSILPLDWLFNPNILQCTTIKMWIV